MHIFLLYKTILRERRTQSPTSSRKGSRKEKISSDKFASLPEKCLFGQNWFRRKGKLKTIGLSLQQTNTTLKNLLAFEKLMYGKLF